MTAGRRAAFPARARVRSTTRPLLELYGLPHAAGASNDPGDADGKVRSHRFAAANTAVPFVNHDQEQLKRRRTSSVRLCLRGHLRRVAGDGRGARRWCAAGEGPPPRTRRSRSARRPSRRRRSCIREVGHVAAPLDRAQPSVAPRQHRPRRRRRPHSPHRPLLPGRHRRRVRCLARAAGARRRRASDFWSGQVEDEGRGPVEPGAHFYRVVPARRRRQPDQQAQRVAGTQPALHAPDSARRRRCGALPPRDPEGRERPHHFDREAEPPQVLALLHPVSYAGQPKPGQPPAAIGLVQQPEYRSTRGGSGERVRADQGRDSGAADFTLAEATATLAMGDARRPQWTPAS